MKRLALLVGVLFVAFTVFAQELQEIDGLYYQDSQLFSGEYTTHLKMEM